LFGAPLLPSPDYENRGKITLFPGAWPLVLACGQMRTPLVLQRFAFQWLM